MMRTGKIRIGLISPSSEQLRLIKSLLVSTSASVCTEAGSYAEMTEENPLNGFTYAQPEVALVDMAQPEGALETIRLLRSKLPRTWILAVAEAERPQLILEAMRAGAREFLTKPVTAAALEEAFQRFSEETVSQDGIASEVGALYAVTGAKQGSGASTLAINLAAGLSQITPRGKTAILDLGEPVGDVAPYLNLKPEFCLSDVLDSYTRLDPVLLESFMESFGKVRILAGLKQYQQEARLSSHPEAIGRLLSIASRAYDHVVLDFDGTVDPGLFDKIADKATTVVVALTPELPALWRTHRLLEFINLDRCAEKIKLVLNRAQKGKEITEKEIEKTLGASLFWSLPNDYESAISAINSGRALVLSNHSALARGYIGLARALSGIRDEKKNRSIFSMFTRN